MRKILALVALSAVIVSSLTACTPPEPERVTTTVGSGGFSLTLGNVTATSTAGVAPEGTEVTLEVTAKRPGADLSGITTPLGESVSLTLGEGLQPATPIDFRFPINESAIASEEWSNDDTLLIATQSDDGTLGLLETSRNGGFLTATTDHLSFFQPIQLNWSAAMNAARDAVMQSLGLEFPKPNCVDKPATASTQIKYEVSSTGAVWPCISADGDKITVNLYAATMLPYRALSHPAVVGGTVASPDGQGMLMALANKWVPSASGGVLMGGGASAQFTFDAANPPQFLDVRQDAHMLIGAALLNLLGIILNPLGGGAAFMEKVGQLDCISGIVTAGTSPELDASTVAEMFKTTLACLGTLAVGATFPVRLALGLIGAVPVLFAGSIVGLINEISGNGSERIEIKSSVEPWAITFNGIGPFSIGRTTWDETAAKASFNGWSDNYNATACAVGGWYETGTIYDGVSVLAADASSPHPGTLDVVGINSWARTGVAASIPAKTSEGIALGSSEADVRKAYPQAEPYPRQINPVETLYPVEDGAGRAILISTLDGKVVDISVGNIPEIYYPEGCA